MYRKLIACLLVFLLICSPAYASTSSSALDYQVLPMSLDDGIMTAALTQPSVSIANAYFDSIDGTVSTGSFKSFSGSLSGVEGSTNLLSLFTSDYDFSSGSCGFVFRFQNMNNSSYSSSMGGSWDIKVNGLLPMVNFSSGSFSSYYPYVDFSRSNVVRCVANLTWSGTGKYTNSNTGSVSWVTLDGTVSNVPVNLSFSDMFQTVVSGFSAPYFNVGTINFSVPFDLPDTVTEDGYLYEVVSGSVSSMDIQLFFGCRPSNLITSTTDVPFSDTVSLSEISALGNSLNQRSRFVFTGLPYVSIQSRSSSDLGSSLSNSLSTLSSSLSSGFSEVKRTISQGASEVKTEISNQTQTLSDKLTDVKDGVVEGITGLKETTEQGFEDVVQGITDLPANMQEMLLGFVVPDVDTVADKMSDFQRLAEEKLGIIYQVPSMMFDAFDAIVNGAVNPQTTMVFPAFSLPWIDGTQLKLWDSQEFEIIPSGLEVLRELIQTITSMVFVIMTFNSLKRTYERFFLGGER